MGTSFVPAVYRELIAEFVEETGMTSDELVVQMVHAMVDTDYEYAPEGLYMAVHDEQCRIFLLTCMLHVMQRSLVDLRELLRYTADRFRTYRPMAESDDELAEEAGDMADATLTLVAVTSRIDIVNQIYRRVDKTVHDVLYLPEGGTIDYNIGTIDVNMVSIRDELTVSQKSLDAVTRLKHRSNDLQDVSKGLTKLVNRSDTQIVNLLRWLRRVEMDVDAQFKQPMKILNNQIRTFDFNIGLPQVQQSFDKIFFIDDRVRSLVLLFRMLNGILPDCFDDPETDPLLTIAAMLREEL